MHLIFIITLPARVIKHFKTNLYEENLPISDDEIAFAVEFLPGQYDQRADSASECIGLLGAEERVEVKSAKVIVLKGN